jgi:hypothetical protein
MGPLPRTMSVPDAGERLGVGPTTARRLARIYRETGGAYGIPNIRVGHKLRVPGVLLAAYVAEDRITPPDFADELASRRRPSREVRTRREPPVGQLPLFPAG